MLNSLLKRAPDLGAARCYLEHALVMLRCSDLKPALPGREA